jgi:hypothetical protein
MLRALLAILFVTFILTACTQRMICPAYQSAYIYDKDQLRKRFSYFQEDSTPKIYTASKTKYLIAEPVSYRKKMRSMQTVPVKPVKTVLPDSLALEEGEGLLGEESADSISGVDPGSELDQAARSVIDSTYIVDVPQDSAAAAEDSVYMISKDKETRVLRYNFPDSLHYDEESGRYLPETPKYEIVHVTFNVDQDNYMWYLRDYLVLPDVRLAQVRQSEEDKPEKKQRKGLKGFLAGLFGKKKKEAPVETAPPPPKSDEEDFDFIEDEEAADTLQTAPVEQKEKKGLFRRKKKPKEEKPAEDEKEDTPAPPKEEKKPDEPEPEPEKEDGF